MNVCIYALSMFTVGLLNCPLIISNGSDGFHHQYLHHLTSHETGRKQHSNQLLLHHLVKYCMVYTPFSICSGFTSSLVQENMLKLFSPLYHCWGWTERRRRKKMNQKPWKHMETGCANRKMKRQRNRKWEQSQGLISNNWNLFKYPLVVKWIIKFYTLVVLFSLKGLTVSAWIDSLFITNT